MPARKRGSEFSPDDPALVHPLLEADLIFMGPGSPTYAVRQLRDSLAWHYLLARHQLGATLVFASAAVVAISAFALPVYEIYKVGDRSALESWVGFLRPVRFTAGFYPALE